MESSILSIIGPIKDSLSEDEYDRTKRYLSFYESSFNSQKAELAHKLDNSIKNCNILTKELEHYKRDHGDLFLSNKELQLQFTESSNECTRLKARLAAMEQEGEVQRLNAEVEMLKKQNNELQLQFTESSNECTRLKARLGATEQEVKRLNAEVGMLKKQNTHLIEENWCLEAKKKSSEGELRGFKIQYQGLHERFLKLEEREKAEIRESEMEKARLKRNLDSVTTASNERFKSFRIRLLKLEQDMAGFDSDSGSQLINTVLQDQDQEQEHESHETPTIEENTAAPMPSCSCTKATEPTNISRQPECHKSDTRPAGHVETRTVAEENLASSMSCINNSQVASPSVVDLTSSDDDDELSLPKGIKRKLSSAVASNTSNMGEDESGGSSKHRLRQCEQSEQKVGEAFRVD